MKRLIHEQKNLKVYTQMNRQPMEIMQSRSYMLALWSKSNESGRQRGEDRKYCA